VGEGYSIVAKMGSENGLDGHRSFFVVLFMNICKQFWRPQMRRGKQLFCCFLLLLVMRNSIVAWEVK
jgi:hypothetical protein